MTTDETVELDDFVTITLAIHEAETHSLGEVMSLIDATLRDIGSTNICSSGEITDRLLDIRNIVSPIVEARSVQ